MLVYLCQKSMSDLREMRRREGTIESAEQLVSNPYKVLDILASLALPKEQRILKVKELQRAVEKEVDRSRERDRHHRGPYFGNKMGKN